MHTAKLATLKPEARVDTKKEAAKDLRTVATDLQTIEGRYETRVKQLGETIKKEGEKVANFVEVEMRLLRGLEEETAKSEERIQKDYKGFRDAAEAKLVELKEDFRETKVNHKEAVSENAKYIAQSAND